MLFIPFIVQHKPGWEEEGLERMARYLANLSMTFNDEV